MNIPEVTFKTRIGDNQILGGGCSIGGQWQDINTNEKPTTNETIKEKSIKLFILNIFIFHQNPELKLDYPHHLTYMV